jgi:glutaredoxin-related protein
MANSSTIEFHANVCAICHVELNELDISHVDSTLILITLNDKGLKTLLHFSELKSHGAPQAF